MVGGETRCWVVLFFFETRVATRWKHGESFELWRYATRLDLPLFLQVVLYFMSLGSSCVGSRLYYDID